MKFFVCIALFATVFSVAYAVPLSTSAAAVAAEQEAKAEQTIQAVNLQSAYDMSRFRKSAYGGGASSGAIPAPPCPKNYLFSCQPNLAPVACAAPAPGMGGAGFGTGGAGGAGFGTGGAAYGSAGAYSAPIPTYIF